MNSVNKTLYIPLYGKATVSRAGILLRDPKAEEIWAAEGFPLKGKSRSKWLAYNMAMRGRVFDDAVAGALQGHPDALVLHLGCGMDSRVLRLGMRGKLWFDVDFPEVIGERRRYFQETEDYRMIGGDLREDWLKEIPSGMDAVVVMEGVSMYLTRPELCSLLGRLTAHLGKTVIFMDCYTEFAAKATKYKNPINDVGVTQVYGVDEGKELEDGTGLRCVRELDMTPQRLIEELPKREQRFFRTLFAGKIAKKLYRMYEYKKDA